MIMFGLRVVLEESHTMSKESTGRVSSKKINKYKTQDFDLSCILTDFTSNIQHSNIEMS